MFNSIRVIICTVPWLLAGMVSADVIDGEELSDPTRPLARTAAAPATSSQAAIAGLIPVSYDLSFVRASESSPIAVVNDQRVTIGDVIGNAEVTAIDRNGVTLLINSEERRITMYDSNVKSPIQSKQTQQ